MSLHRTHILLDPEQHKALTRMARREGKSVSEITREIVELGIEQRQRLVKAEQNRRLEAVEKARRVRRAMLEGRGGKPLDVDIAAMLDDIREEGDANILKRSD